MQIISRPGWGRRVVVGLAVAGATFGIAGAVQASIPDGNGIVHACYTTTNLNGYPPGALRAIDTAKVNGRCFAGEAPVDLATPQYVQNVVTSTVNQTAIMGEGSFVNLSAADHWIQWTCGGWVAANPTVSIDADGATTANAPVALHTMANVEMENSGFPGTTVRVYFTLSSIQSINTQVTCYDPRVYGETYPVTAPVAHPSVTVGP